ncbi:hypothetical protein [Oceaniglobus trochenteri]|uniref:hypothetical protein n=1 Tax=Oceaniglobus trochenteri TaxID=2763260 RepID=UPI001CFF875D|nr:hypothetical protein [Oceaniglobus trochenteri]
MNVLTHVPQSFEQGRPDHPRDTATSNAFAALLPILTENIDAQRDLEDVGFSMDTPYTNWMRDAERAEDRLMDVLKDLRTLPLETPEDIPLRRIANMLHEMRRSQVDTARDIHRRFQEGFDLRFVLRDTSATARHRNLLMQWSQPLIASFAALPIFAADTEEGDMGDDDIPPPAI